MDSSTNTASAAKPSPQVIIKRVKKGGHEGGHHGGAWKVAYADFITAMMALFLVLWLVAVMSIDGKKAIAEYFRSYTIFKGTEAGGGKGISVMMGNPVKLDKEPGDIKNTGTESAKIVVELGRIIEAQLGELKDNLLIFTTNEGVRIEMVDRENKTMFELGRANLLMNGRKVLTVLASTFKDQQYTIHIEGHTDSVKYPQEDYTNWELAADRANAARRELIRNGLDPRRITRVTSFADTALLNPDRPLDPSNRRVSILIETEKKSELPEEGGGPTRNQQPQGLLGKPSQ
ncbi:MAG: flagellar motor protein MotB [Deltaproteobacteria bacterium]|nr:flagellar motor protein MotB [Deltaproteobacteria bacterium]